MNQEKINRQTAQELALNLSQKDEIDQKCNYFKSMIKTKAELIGAIDEKLLSEIGNYEKCKLIIEKLDIDNEIFSLKGFYEMWLQRANEYDKKFAMITQECNDKFDEIESEARELSKRNPILKMAMDNYDAQENKTQRLKNEYYAMLKFEVIKANPSRKLEYNVGNK